MQDLKKRQLDRDLTENEIKQIASHVVKTHGDNIGVGVKNDENEKKLLLQNQSLL